MTDARADDDLALDEGRLPWLEAVDEEDEREGPGTGKMIAFVLIGLAAIGLIIGGLFWLGNRDLSAEGEGQLIAAPEGDYKVKPEEAGGMEVEGKGDTAFAASEGADPQGEIAIDRLPEAPVTKPSPESKAAPAATPSPTPTAMPVPAAAPATGGGTIQLGAFSSQASASNAWKALSGRFKYLEPLTHSVTATESGGRTLYRLRASGPGASELCGRLKVAGESCVVIG